MRDGSFYDTLVELNIHIYKQAKDFNNWKVLDTFADNSGVYIALYDIGNNETLFAIRGTQLVGKEDLLSDIAMAFTQELPSQFHRAETFYKQIKDKYPNIIFTGHSLGGSIAQMLGTKYGNETITFEAFGVGKLLNNHTDNIINFGNNYDLVFMINFEHQVGHVFILPVKFIYQNWLYAHKLEYCGKPSKAKEITEPKYVYKAKVQSLCNKNLNVAYNAISDTTHVVNKYVRKGILPDAKQKVNDFQKARLKQKGK